MKLIFKRKKKRRKINQVDLRPMKQKDRVHVMDRGDIIIMFVSDQKTKGAHRRERTLHVASWRLLPY